ncbi:hypothetical protein CB0940_08866 [Cercospora beticola]|uniref:Uncharacterized protein n=1 Tax=Cercospora beticola TaxID=122368 RepID=A0A2G5HQH3_CERBT|nr:hypothetical protein CB0940_08866 [Cercospora beticola]PIA94780.1 hypothetical protein CB0940_08866 [Cercospora beticola]
MNAFCGTLRLQFHSCARLLRSCRVHSSGRATTPPCFVTKAFVATIGLLRRRTMRENSGFANLPTATFGLLRRIAGKEDSRLPNLPAATLGRPQRIAGKGNSRFAHLPAATFGRPRETTGKGTAGSQLEMEETGRLRRNVLRMAWKIVESQNRRIAHKTYATTPLR